LSSSLDSLLSPASRDVFTASLAQSVQELWLIITSPATVVAGAGLKGIVMLDRCKRCHVSLANWLDT